MKIRMVAAMVGALLAVPAFAGGDRALEQAAEENDLSVREMRMLAGAPTSYASYRTSYLQARDKMRRGYVDTRPLPPRAERAPPVEEPRDSAETYALPEDR
jgi:hypothetical protein